MDILHELLNYIVDIAILLFEFMGVLVVIASGVRGIYDYLRRNPLTRLNLAKGLAMGLEFKLGSEILRTVVVRDWRAALTVLIHWEIKNEEPALSIFPEKKDEPGGKE